MRARPLTCWRATTTRTRWSRRWLTCWSTRTLRRRCELSRQVARTGADPPPPGPAPRLISRPRRISHLPPRAPPAIPETFSPWRPRHRNQRSRDLRALAGSRGPQATYDALELRGGLPLRTSRATTIASGARSGVSRHTETISRHGKTRSRHTETISRHAKTISRHVETISRHEI